MSIKELISKINKIVLIICLPLIAIIDTYNTLEHVETLEDILSYIVILTLINSLLFFYFNSKKIKAIISALDTQNNNNSDTSPTKHWHYKNIIGLLLILALFTAIKAPFLNNSFATDTIHTLKYNSYVEPALYMSENNNPFWLQRKYLADPINNPEGISNKFSQLPLLEWSLFATYKLLPFNSIEINTRIVTHLIGMLILIFAYLFLKNWFSKKQTLIIVFLLSISPLLTYSTFLTVYDSMLIMFTFASLFFLDKYYKQKDFKYLFIAGILFGIGNACKYSLFLWLAPISLFLMYYKESDNKYSLFKNYLIYFFLALLPIATTQTSIIILPSQTTKGLLLFLVWILFYIFLFVYLKKYQEKITTLISKIFAKKILLALIIIFTSTALYAFLKQINLIGGTSNFFLTNSRLIFYFPMYKNILFHQLSSYMTINVYIIGVMGLILIYFTKKTNDIKLTFAILFSALLYLIIASKTIFFHSYYTLIFIILFSILSSYLLLLVYNIQKNTITKYFIVICFLLIILPKTYYLNIKNIGKEKNKFAEAVEYLKQNSNINDLYIDESSLTELVLKTGRGRVGNINSLNNSTFKKSIQQIGFAKTMEKYNIKFLITANKEPIYYNYVNLFSKEKLESRYSRRTDMIHTLLDSEYEFFKDIKKREEIIKKYNLQNKFKLEKRIGYYNFFSFKN